MGAHKKDAEYVRSETFRMRITREEAFKLEYVSTVTGKTKSDIMREMLERIYKDIYEKETEIYG